MEGLKYQKRDALSESDEGFWGGHILVLGFGVKVERVLFVSKVCYDEGLVNPVEQEKA